MTDNKSIEINISSELIAKFLFWYWKLCFFNFIIESYSLSFIAKFNSFIKILTLLLNNSKIFKLLIYLVNVKLNNLSLLYINFSEKILLLIFMKFNVELSIIFLSILIFKGFSKLIEYFLSLSSIDILNW